MYQSSPGAAAQWGRRLVGDYGYAAAVLVAMVIAWEVAVVVTEVPERLLPPPSLVFETILDRWPDLVSNGWTTLGEVLLGFALSVVVGIPLAILIVSSRVFERVLYPLLVASQAVPKIAIAPLFVIWLGFGTAPKVLIAFLIAFFPVVIDTVVGLRSIDPDMLQMARSMGTSRTKTLLNLRLPNALPNIFGGLKVAITLAVVGAIVGEFVGADRGLGNMLQVAAGNLNGPLLFAALVVLSLMAIVLFVLIEVLERLSIPWHVSERSRHVGM